MGTGKFDAGVVGREGGNPVMDQCPIHGDQISQNKYYLSIFEIYTQFKIFISTLFSVLCSRFYEWTKGIEVDDNVSSVEKSVKW